MLRGLNRLQQTGTLPTVWIPPGPLRDQRELPRIRMVFATARTRLKNRIHSVLDKYGLQDQFAGISDIFGGGVREHLERRMRPIRAVCCWSSWTRWRRRFKPWS